MAPVSHALQSHASWRAMVHPDSWFIVVNPASGGGRARRYAPRLRAALDRRRLPYECVTTTAAGDARGLVAKALADGYRRLLALGGDGSFHELVNGLVAEASVPPAQCLVAVAALGTGNDWARTMQVPDDPEQLAACMARARGRRVDLGMAEDARGQRLAFHNVAGAGLDAEVLRRLPRGAPRILAYLAGLARTIPRFRAPEFELVIDGRKAVRPVPAGAGGQWPALRRRHASCGRCGPRRRLAGPGHGRPRVGAARDGGAAEAVRRPPRRPSCVAGRALPVGDDRRPPALRRGTGRPARGRDARHAERCCRARCRRSTAAAQRNEPRILSSFAAPGHRRSYGTAFSAWSEDPLRSWKSRRFSST